jgi:modulator of FtsH protease HflK
MRQINIDPAVVIRFVPIVVLGILALIVLVTSWVTIDPEERGVVLRFGKYNRTLDPGLHFKIPFGLDRVYKVPVQRQLKEEFGFQTTQAGTRSQFANRNFLAESQMLTGDLNVANVEWVTQFRISNPRHYLFNVRNLHRTFRDMNEAVMREMIGDHSINEVLTVGRRDIELLVKAELQERCNQYEMGLTIDQVILQDVNPPDLVKPAFNQVNQAQQEMETLINQARAEFNRIIPRERGDAQRKIEEAEGYAIERVNRARGEAERFNAVFTEYTRAPEVTRQRIYLETMEVVMDKVGRKLILDEDASGILPFLNLNQDQPVTR